MSHPATQAARGIPILGVLGRPSQIAFVGAFAVGLALGWTPAAAARLGCAAAADSVTRPGTQSSFATREAAAAIRSAAQS